MADVQSQMDTSQFNAFIRNLDDDTKWKILDYIDQRPRVAIDNAIDDYPSCPPEVKDTIKQQNGIIVDQFDDLLARDDILSNFLDQVSTGVNPPFITGRQFSSSSPSASANVNQKTIEGAHAEAFEMLNIGKLSNARLGMGATGRSDEKVRGDSVTWLKLESQEPSTINGRAIIEKIDLLRKRLNSIKGEEYFTKFEAQLAVYGKGARYAPHFDSTDTSYPHRKLTCLVYLNPDWTANDGGQLCVHKPDGVLTLLPKADRFFIFPSRLVEHEVKPSLRDRTAIATWHHGA
eukprot:Selendium_serpulae@DN6029_c0_g1_i2.p2